MDFATMSPLGILAVFGGLILFALVLFGIAGAKYSKPTYYDEVLIKAKDLTGQRKHTEAHILLQKAVERLSNKKQLPPELSIRLARMRLSCGRLLALEGKVGAASFLRLTITTPNAEPSIVDEAIVALLATRETQNSDLPVIQTSVLRMANPAPAGHPLVQALDEAFFRKCEQDLQSRGTAQAIVSALYMRGVRTAWIARMHGHALAASQQQKESIQIFRELVTDAAATRDDKRMLSRLLLQQNQPAQAFPMQQALADDEHATTEDRRAAGSTALLLYESATKKSAAMLDQCIGWLRLAADAERQHAETWRTLARAELLRGRKDRAKAAYEFAILAGADDVAMHLTLGDLLLDMQDPVGACTHLRRAAELTATDGNLWLRVGRLALANGDAAAAVQDLERSVKCKGAPGDAPLILADAYARVGNHRRVIDLLSTRKKLPAASLLLLARAHAQLGENAAAVERLQQYLAGHTADQPALYELAMLHGRLGAWAQAAAQFELLKDRETRRTALPYAAYVALRADQVESAERLLREANSAGVDAALLHHVAASLAARRGDADAARAAWKRALEREPKFPAALHAFAHFCEAQRDHEQAAALFTALHKATPDNTAARIRIGVCLTRAGKYQEAITAFHAIGAAVDADVEALECMTYSYAKLQNWAAATAALEKLPKSGRRAAAKQRNEFVIRYELARAHYQRGAYSEARVQLELLPANQLGQSAVTRAIYAAQTAAVGKLLPPIDLPALHTALDHLRRIAPASFAALVVPALVSLAKNGTPPRWASIADVRPVNAAQQAALAILAAAAGEPNAAQVLLDGLDSPISALLRGVAAAGAKQWSAAFDALGTTLQAGPPADGSIDTLLRLTAACGIAAGKHGEVRSLLQRHSPTSSAMRILGVMATADEHYDEATKLLTSANLHGAGIEQARQALAWRALRTALQSEDPEAALQAIAALPPEVREQPSIVDAQFEMLMRWIERTIAADAKNGAARQLLHVTAPLLLMRTGYLRRAAIVATRVALESSGSWADVTSDHRLAASLWATALTGGHAWETMDRERIAQKRTPLPTERRASLRDTARERLLSSLRSRAMSGWSKDQVDLGCAWVEYEFECTQTFDESGVAYGLSAWPKELAAAPLLFMADEPAAASPSKAGAERAAIVGLLAQFIRARAGDHEKRAASRSIILGVLAQQTRGGRRTEENRAVYELATYLPLATGFAEYLLDTERPHLALMQLDNAPKSDAAVNALRGRALAAQATKLSAIPSSAAEALTLFEHAAALQANLIDSRSSIIDAAVVASRNLLNANAQNPAAALQPLDAATRLAGKATPLDQARAAVFVQQALQLKAKEDLDGAIRRLRDARALHDDDQLRQMLGNVLHDKSVFHMFKRQHQEALNLMRESVRLTSGKNEKDADYTARCDLQMALINFGAEIADADDVTIKDLRTAVVIGEDARWFLDDDDAEDYLGAVLSKLGRYLAIDKNLSEAIKTFESSLRYREHEGTRKMLGIALYMRGAQAYDAGNRSSGSADIKRAYQLNPDDEDIRKAHSIVRSNGW
jgi:Tfp pilus assembly protein PilF